MEGTVQIQIIIIIIYTKENHVWIFVSPQNDLLFIQRIDKSIFLKLNLQKRMISR